MTSNKRKDVEAMPDSNDTTKKTKTQNEGAGLSTFMSRMSMIQGPDDAAIKSLFLALFYSINIFVQSYFKGSPYFLPRRNGHKAFFDNLTANDYKEYLKSKHPGAKEAIITAAIWNKLISPLLSTPIKAFDWEIPENRIKTRTSGDEEGFYAWRTFTAHFLSNNYEGPTSWGEGGERRGVFVEEMISLLLNHSVIKEEDKLETDLEGIADKAYELATAMARSRAYWVCAVEDPRIGQLHGFKIKTDRMDDVDLWDEDEKSTIVDLVKTPMLLKFGNSDGQNYDQCCVVCKAKVVMKAKNATH